MNSTRRRAKQKRNGLQPCTEIVVGGIDVVGAVVGVVGVVQNVKRPVLLQVCFRAA